METKHYISTIEDDEVKAYCIMSDTGYVMACEQMRDDKKFYEEVKRLSKYYNCIKIVESTFEGQEQIDKLNKRKYSTIPNLSNSIGKFLKTEKGKKLVLKYVEEQNGFDYCLLEELVEFSRKKS